MEGQKSSSRVRFTTILKKYPTFRDSIISGSWTWLAGRRKDDNAEGLWRVHDKIYDLEDFAENHPGGKEWITLTKGIDITEAFESYHIRSMPSEVLKKFLVKEAELPRNYMLTYEENGFYRVLKRRVAEMLPTLDKSDLWKSKLYMDLIVLGLFCLIISAVQVECTYYKAAFMVLSGLLVACIQSTSHNFTHQRNNWRMYTSCLIGMNWMDYRVTHAISHHSYTNTFADLEVGFFDPFVMWTPIPFRSKLRVVISFIMTLVCCIVSFHFLFVGRIACAIVSRRKIFFWFDALALIPTIVMFLCDRNQNFNLESFLYAFLLWNLIIMIGSFIFLSLAISSGHHSTDLVHEGDELKSLDFGIFQVSTTFDRSERDRNYSIASVTFGNHVLHHLFPSLDHALLPQLRDIFIQTCKEFDCEYKEYSLFQGFIEQLKQLKRRHVTILDDNNKRIIFKNQEAQDANNNLDEVKT